MVQGDKTVARVVTNGMCTGCGSCAALCPKSAIGLTIGIDNGIYVPTIDGHLCNECGICYEVCPGHSVDFERLNKNIFNKIPENILAGNYIGCYVGHATDDVVRSSSTSGGLVTQVLIYALENGIIDGALVTRMADDDPSKPEPFIARTKEEIISGSKSKYCPVPACIALKDVLKSKEIQKIAVVGLPCHLHGIRKAEEIFPALKQKIVLHIGIFCSHTVDFNGTEHIFTRLKIPRDDIVKVEYRTKGWPGGINITQNDGSEKFLHLNAYWPAIFGRFFFTPYRCTLCCDGLAELADISCGDAWLPEFRFEKRGESIIIARTEIGTHLLQTMLTEKRLDIISVGFEKVLQSQRDQILFKQKNISARRDLLRRIGKPLPDYGERQFLPHDRWDKVTAPIPYGHIWISGSRVGKWVLERLPLIALGIYGSLVQKMYNRSYGMYRSITTEPIMKDPQKIYIVNSYSPNLGDLAIISTMLATLKDEFPRTEFVVSADNPEVTSAYVPNVKLTRSLSSRSSGQLRQYLNHILYYRNLTWLYFKKRGINLFFLARRSTRQALSEYLDADMIVSCGGGYLNDNAGSAFLGCLRDLEIGVRLKKPVVLYAQSIGPFNNEHLKSIASDVLSSVSAINLRDEISVKYVEDLNLKNHLPVKVTADIANLLPLSDIQYTKDLLIEEGLDITQPFVTMTLKPWSFPGSPDSEKKRQSYIDALNDLIRHINRNYHMSVLLIPMDIANASKSRFKNVIKKYLAKFIKLRDLSEKSLINQILKENHSNERLRVLKGRYSPSVVKTIISLSELHVATRMHSSIFAASAGVPILGIAYEPKMKSFMEILHQEDYLMDIYNVDALEIITRFDNLWEKRQESKQKILKQSIELNSKANENAGFIRQTFLNWKAEGQG